MADPQQLQVKETLEEPDVELAKTLVQVAAATQVAPATAAHAAVRAARTEPMARQSVAAAAAAAAPVASHCRVDPVRNTKRRSPATREWSGSRGSAALSAT